MSCVGAPRCGSLYGGRIAGVLSLACLVSLGTGAFGAGALRPEPEGEPPTTGSGSAAITGASASAKRKTPASGKATTPTGSRKVAPPPSAKLAPIPMRLDLARVPFSRFGSYLAFSEVTRLVPSLLEGVGEGEGLYLRNVHAGARQGALRVDVLVGRKAAAFRTEASAGRLRLLADAGSVEIGFANASVVRVRAQGVGLRLATLQPGAYDAAFSTASGRWELNLASHSARYALVALAGSLEVDAPVKALGAERIVADFVPAPETGVLEAVIETYETHSTSRGLGKPPFEACVRESEEEFARFLRKTPAAAPPYEEARRLAAYVLWSAGVQPEGRLKRTALLSSKNEAIRVSSWGGAFGGLALAADDLSLAWDQLLLPFDQQHAGGALPGSHDAGGAQWSFTTPPVHGVVLRALMRRSRDVGPRQLAEIYGPLSRSTLFWLEGRDDDRDGVPQYNHGRDSGWDDATVFRAGLPLEAPDLSAFLIVQMDVLAEIARSLRKPAEARQWKARADTLLDKLLRHSWKVNRFIAPRSGDHKVGEGDSLALFLPLVLGNRLAEDARRALVLGLREGGRFSTHYGLATESVKSSGFEAGSHWRGPIQPASTWLFVEALAAVGEEDLGREIARRFCDMVVTSGMAESFDAQTGQGLGDPAHTVTASVFLDLSSRYAPKQP